MRRPRRQLLPPFTEEETEGLRARSRAWTQEVWFQVSSDFQALPLDTAQDPMLEDGSGAEDGTESKQGVFTKTNFLP